MSDIKKSKKKKKIMPPKELWEAYSNCTVQSVRPSRFVSGALTPRFFEVGIPNLVCGYILEWWSVASIFGTL